MAGEPAFEHRQPGIHLAFLRAERLPGLVDHRQYIAVAYRDVLIAGFQKGQVALDLSGDGGAAHHFGPYGSHLQRQRQPLDRLADLDDAYHLVFNRKNRLYVPGSLNKEPHGCVPAEIFLGRDAGAGLARCSITGSTTNNVGIRQSLDRVDPLFAQVEHHPRNDQQFDLRGLFDDIDQQIERGLSGIWRAL